MIFYPLKVVEYVPETFNSASFVFEIPEDLRATFDYKAGQFLNFQIPWKDFFIERCYSLSSSPITDARLQVTIKRAANGRASNWFNDEVREGSQVMVAAPSGRFVLKEQHDNALIFFAGGSGITPILSLIQTALLTTDRPIQLIYANSDTDSIIFKQTLDRLATEHSNQFSCHYYLSCHHHLDSDGAHMNQQKIEDLVAQRWDADFYICGPTPFMDTVEATLADHKVNDERTFIERFVSSIDFDCAEKQIQIEQEADIGDVKLKITADGKDFDVEYLSGKSLLESILADKTIEAEIPFSCQEGHCGSCMSILKQGDVDMRANRALSKRDLAKGYVLACQSVPTSNEIWIDFDV
ncbi:MAG: ferredoxin--NADP reductase [Porticoccus sp.]|nr:ferredoxin--NADP reductase [Porticoccus sp.]